MSRDGRILLSGGSMTMPQYRGGPYLYEPGREYNSLTSPARVLTRCNRVNRPLLHAIALLLLGRVHPLPERFCLPGFWPEVVVPVSAPGHAKTDRAQRLPECACVLDRDYKATAKERRR
ncbi:uncharacterized protein MCYG_00424 [Microsporum canis CBS 113480]|uniref:Uncharacterized protein n=1 Tax=Arthroderma otae (strain ATCC MYA-4605 / CBS 113480) TaxID=554155 RepID=C5FCK2_ARTOC|nr:uncharacterized protein MCYG_00424 [Microsporum canis CBS 113480]EEQ27536.1 predicted protein [Microsporum canis CBS 113480]